jgi:hypothetical protein
VKRRSPSVGLLGAISQKAKFINASGGRIALSPRFPDFTPLTYLCAYVKRKYIYLTLILLRVFNAYAAESNQSFPWLREL